MLYLISSIFELGTKVLVGCMGSFDGVLGEMADAAEFLKPWNNMSEKYVPFRSDTYCLFLPRSLYTSVCFQLQYIDANIVYLFVQ